MIIPPLSNQEKGLLPLIVQKLERGSTPSNKWPGSHGKYWSRGDELYGEQLRLWRAS